jgi:hypothetical protein
MEFLLGLTDVDMKVNILMIRKRVMVTFIGQMEESMREDGKMVNSTVLVLILQLVVKLNKVNGMMVKDFIGYLVEKEEHEGTIFEFPRMRY